MRKTACVLLVIGLVVVVVISQQWLVAVLHVHPVTIDNSEDMLDMRNTRSMIITDNVLVVQRDTVPTVSVTSSQPTSAENRSHDHDVVEVVLTESIRTTSFQVEFAADEGLINVVSMSLYGSDRRYTAGAVRNAQLIRQNFPGWQLWIFVESLESSRYDRVPPEVVSHLVDLGADIHYITPLDDMVPPMMWRFLVADDPAVDRFIVRDVDSRLSRRDAASVVAWIRSGQPFHCIRDHPSHAGYALSGGLWGGRAPALRRILRRSWAVMMRGSAGGYLDDMKFLNDIIWPRVDKHAYCTDSVSCDKWTGSFPFPVARHGHEHVGQVYDENDVVRHIDTKILQQSGENIHCIPL